MSLPALVRLFPLFYFRFYVDKQNKAHIEFGTYQTFFRGLIVFELWYSVLFHVEHKFDLVSVCIN